MDSLHLHQIPINLDEWTKLTVFLSCAEEGALMRAVRVSWAAGLRGETPGTLPDDDQQLARALGGEAEHVSLLRRFFAPDGEGRLCWGWLAALYQTALAKYQLRKAAAETRWQRPDARPGKSRRPKEIAVVPCNADAMHVQPKPNSSRKQNYARTRPRAPAAALAAASRAAPAVQDRPPEPTALEVDAWVQANPGESAELEAAVDAQMTEINPGWRSAPMGAPVRSRYLRAAITDRMLSARASPSVPSPEPLVEVHA